MQQQQQQEQSPPPAAAQQQDHQQEQHQEPLHQNDDPSTSSQQALVPQQRPQQHDDRHPPLLDFTSPAFDPLLALSTEGLRVPVPDAPLYDYLSKCRHLLPPEAADQLVATEGHTPSQQTPGQRSLHHHPQQQRQQHEDDDPAASSEAAAAARSEAALLAAEAARAKAARQSKAEALKQRAQQAIQRAEAGVGLAPLPEIMALVGDASPLASLRRWLGDRRRVTVVTRHAAGVRGRAVGTLVAFDRYMNLVLRDVEETYTVIVKVARVKEQQLPAADPQQQRQTRQRVRWCRKQEHRFRRLDLVMVKGDQVVLVAAAGGDGGAMGGGSGGGSGGRGGG